MPLIVRVYVEQILTISKGTSATISTHMKHPCIARHGWKRQAADTRHSIPTTPRVPLNKFCFDFFRYLHAIHFNWGKGGQE